MTQKEQVISDPTRVKAFANFFKKYMSISAVVAAALPIPVTGFKLIPTYHAQTSLLATYTSLFCFLLLGFIFYTRHALARLMFPQFFGKKYAFSKDGRPWQHQMLMSFTRLIRFVVAILPALLILASLVCVSYYHENLDESVRVSLNSEALEAPTVSPTSSEASPKARTQVAKEPKTSTEVLAKLESWQIPFGSRLMQLYLGIFLFAEAAFIVMALKEYLQDLVKLSELDLIVGWKDI